jgi:hypothetical protein
MMTSDRAYPKLLRAAEKMSGTLIGKLDDNLVARIVLKAMNIMKDEWMSP